MRVSSILYVLKLSAGTKLFCLCLMCKVYYKVCIDQQGLKNLLFGNPKVSFTPEWRNQSFSFCDLYGLEYGIVQLKVSFFVDVII